MAAWILALGLVWAPAHAGVEGDADRSAAPTPQRAHAGQDLILDDAVHEDPAERPTLTEVLEASKQPPPEASPGTGPLLAALGGAAGLGAVAAFAAVGALRTRRQGV